MDWYWLYFRSRKFLVVWVGLGLLFLVNILVGLVLHDDLLFWLSFTAIMGLMGVVEFVRYKAKRSPQW